MQMRATKAALEASGDEKPYDISPFSFPFFFFFCLIFSPLRSLPRALLSAVMLQEFVLEMSAVLQLSPQVFAVDPPRQ